MWINGKSGKSGKTELVVMPVIPVISSYHTGYKDCETLND